MSIFKSYKIAAGSHVAENYIVTGLDDAFASKFPFKNYSGQVAKAVCIVDKAGDPVFPSSYDADAQAFFTAIEGDGGSLTTTEKEATNTFVVGLKADSLWTKMYAIYPYVGGTATAHKYNLKDPRNLDAAFRITWSGGVTHDANGITGNGSNAYGDTHIIPSTTLGVHNHMGFMYCRTNSIELGCDFGSNTGSFLGTVLYTKYTDNKTYWSVGDGQTTGAANVLSNTQGLISINRGASNLKTIYQNGSSVSTFVPTFSVQNTSSIVVMARRNNANVDSYSSRNQAMTGFCESLDVTEQGNLWTLVQALQTSLSRQV